MSIHPERMQISSPRELVASIPHILGFHPHDSIVLVAFDGDDIVAAVRADIEAVREAMLTPLLNTLTEVEIAQLVVIYYTADPSTTTDWQDALNQRVSVPILDALIVNNSTWRSLLCSDVECCPRDGHVIEYGSTVTETALVFSGSAPFRSREDLVESLRPNLELPTVYEEIEDAIKLLILNDSVAEHLWVTNQFEKCDWNSGQTLARLCVALSDIHVRDALLRCAYDSPNLRSKIRIALHENLNRIPDDFVAPLATVLAGCAWLDGNGALSNAAIARALEVDSDYSLAQLLDRALTHGVPPHVWAESLAAVSMEKCLAGAA